MVAPTAAATNFGWPCFEGTGRQSGYDGANLTACESLYTAGGQAAPYFSYNHNAAVVSGETCPTGGSSVSGAAFYPSSGGSYPTAYQGAFFFADYTRDCIWAMMPASPGGVPVAADRRTFVAAAANPVDLAIGPGGDLYYADAGGTIRRVRYFSGNQPPTAVVRTTLTSGTAPLTVGFDATSSTDPDPADAGLLRYEWDFTDDGTVDATTATANHVYPAGGPYTARLRVFDSLGASGTATVEIQSGNTAPTAVIDTPAATVTFAVGDRISFSGHAVDDEQETLPASGLRWRLLQQHCFTLESCHTHTVQEWDGVASGSFLAPDHEYPSYLELELLATDAGGLTHANRVRLDPKTVELTFATDPPGLQLAVGSGAQTAPFTRTVIQGSANTVSAITPQDVGGVSYAFVAWSDGGEQTHLVTAPATDTTYTATFLPHRVPQANLAVTYVDSEETVGQDGAGSNVLDGDPATFWHTQWQAADPPPPHEIQLDLGGSYEVTNLYYLPRQASSNGRIANYEVYVSADGSTWGDPVATGAFAAATTEQAVTFPATTGRYVRLRALTEVQARAWTSAAELNVGIAPSAGTER